MSSLVTIAVIGATPAAAAGSVTVSPTANLDPDGEAVVVRGTGFDETQGIYVAVCVDNGPGAMPSPCIGGIDTSGEAQSSAWISSDPPSYGDGVATPYGPGGSFEVTLWVVAEDPVAKIDCRKVSCAVVTRADHTATADRSHDTRTPLTFAAGEPTASAGADETATTSAPSPSPVAALAGDAATPSAATTPPRAEAESDSSDGVLGGAAVPLGVVGVLAAAVVIPAAVAARRRGRVPASSNDAN
jgi:hypothetical protein